MTPTPMKPKPPAPTLEEKIQHAFYVMRSPDFLVTDSPLLAATRVPLTGSSPSEIADLIVDMQFHGI